MADATTYSKNSHMVFSKESSAGTTVYPAVFAEFLSETLANNWDKTPANTIRGNRSMNLRPVKNVVGPFSGTCTVLVEPKNIGYFLSGALGEATDSTLESALSYQHDFEVENTLASFTIDWPIAGENYVKRYIGSRFSEVAFDINENKLQATVTIMAQYLFQNARVTAAASSGTTLLVDQTTGITSSDTLIILDRDNPSTELAQLTVTSVDSETQLTVSTIGVSIGLKDIVVLKRQAPIRTDFDMGNELIFVGGADGYLSSGDHALQSLAAKSNIENFKLSIKNNLEGRWGAAGNKVVNRMPRAILAKGVTVTGTISHFHVNPQNIDFLRSNEKVGLRMEFLGDALASNSAAAASGVLESDGAGTVTTTVDTSGEAGNDYAIFVVQGTGALSVSLSGKLITVTLSSTASSNAVATVATAIAALSGVAATSSGSGNVTATDNPAKVFFSGGRDANEIEKLRFDLPDVRFDPFATNMSEDDLVNEEISFTAYRDAHDQREVSVRLRNSKADY